MSLEVINTIASLLTVTIVAATAVAALVQLRHLRAGNQINAILTIGDRLNGKEFIDALLLVNRDLNTALEDPAFRAYDVAFWQRVAPPDVDPRYVEIRRAAIFVGNTYEQLGVLVKNRTVDQDIFVDNYCGNVTGAWQRLKNFTAHGRAATGYFAYWENFEYLTVLSQDWMERYPSSYPKGVRRLELSCPWPVPPPHEGPPLH